MPRRVYSNPPIEEALCEFRFLASEEPAVAVVGRFYDKVKSDYTGAPNERKALEAQLDTSTNAFRFSQKNDKMAFPTEDGRRFVAVGKDVLSIHALRPYSPGWVEDFRPRVAKAYDAYNEAASPQALTRVGVRYINRIEIPTHGAAAINAKDYFTLDLSLPPGLPNRSAGFFYRSECVYDDEATRLIANFGTIQASKHAVTYLLDLDVFWENQQSPESISDALSVADRLRELERDAFELLITDKTRELFNDNAADARETSAQ